MLLSNDNLLIGLAGAGFLSRVKELLEKGANIEARDLNGRTSLHRAAEEGHLEIVKFLVEEKGASIEVRDIEGYTPLHRAASGSSVEVARFLIDKGTNIEVRDLSGYTPLHRAAEKGTFNMVGFLIDKGANIEAKGNYNWPGYSYTPLHLAARRDSVYIVRLLVEKGANIEAKDSNGYTPLDVANDLGKTRAISFLGHRRSEYENELFTAVERGHVSRVRHLLNIGANIEARNARNETPLCAASRTSRLDILQLLLNRGANVNVQDEDQRTPLHHAAYFGKGVELIFGKGANIEAKDRDSCTPLYYAAWGGQLENARFLVDNGANINAVCHTERRKPIHVAAMEGHENVIEFFISQGINVNDVATGNGWTSLHYAASAGKSDAAKTLVDKWAANIGAKNNDGKNPLDVANEFGKTEVVNFLGPKQSEYDSLLFAAVESGNIIEVTNLLNIGANIEARGVKNETPLCVASRIDKLDVLELLLSRNANVNVQDEDQRTPLHHAAYFGKGVELIFGKGANIEAKDRNSCTPLYYAAWGGQLENARFLVDNGANINAVCHTERRKPIHVAAVSGHENVIEFFISKGINVNDVATGNGWTSLHYAASAGKLDAVKMLVEKGANIGAKNNDGKNPLDVANTSRESEVVNFLGPKQSEYDSLLFAAVERGNVSEVTNLLNIGANIEARGVKNETPLCAASRIDKLDVLELLLSRNANVNVQDDDRRTPLHHAAYLGKGVELILGKGAIIEAKDINDWTPLHYAAWGDQSDAAKTLVDKWAANIGAKNKDGKNPLDVANEFGKTEVVNFLGPKQSEYDSLLFAAVESGNVIEVTNLLNIGANIEARGVKNETPLCVASRIDKLDVLELLLSRNANVNVQDDDQKTPLHHAAYFGKGVELILDKGANIEAKDRNSWTPLYYALSKRHLSTVELLLDRKANMEAKVENGWTLLHYAIRRSSKDMIQLLIRRGANTSATDIKGQTVAMGAMLASRSSDILDLVWHSSGSGDGWYYTLHYKPGRSKREVSTSSVDKQISLESIGPRGRCSIGGESENSLQNNEIDYNKGGTTSGASKPSSLMGSIVNWIKGSTESPALLTSGERNNHTVTTVPEVNATLVNDTIMLAILAAGRYRQPIHENLLSPREQSMRLNNIDEDMIIRAMQESEEIGDPNTCMDEVEVSGNKTEMRKGGK